MLHIQIKKERFHHYVHDFITACSIFHSLNTAWLGYNRDASSESRILMRSKGAPPDWWYYKKDCDITRFLAPFYFSDVDDSIISGINEGCREAQVCG